MENVQKKYKTLVKELNKLLNENNNSYNKYHLSV